MTTLTLQINGMSCGNCLNAVQKALSGLDGVSVGSVRMGRADLEYDPARITAAQIEAAVTEEGYPAQAVGVA